MTIEIKLDICYWNLFNGYTKLEIPFLYLLKLLETQFNTYFTHKHIFLVINGLHIFRISEFFYNGIWVEENDQIIITLVNSWINLIKQNHKLLFLLTPRELFSKTNSRICVNFSFWQSFIHTHEKFRYQRHAFTFQFLTFVSPKNKQAFEQIIIVFLRYFVYLLLNF